MAILHSWYIPLVLSVLRVVHGQLLPSPAGAQVKISSQPFPVANAQHLSQIVWTMLGRTAKETIYCVSEAPVSQLRFLCVDCLQKNITDMINFLNSAQDLTRSAGFPTVTLPNVEANPAWTGATIICQAAVGGGTIDSPPSTVDVRYLRGVHVVDANAQGPVLIANQGYRFYVECIKGPDGICQAGGRRKTIHCAVQAHPPPNTFLWLKNGGAISGNTPELSIGTEMIGQSIQCSANNGLYTENDMPTSQAISIDPYTAARLISDNFAQLQNSQPFVAGNRVDINQRVGMACTVEGNPRPVVFWKLRRMNGQVVDAPCPQGLNGQYREVVASALAKSQNVIQLVSQCDLQISNYSYSGQYWCSACSYVSQGYPECSPSLDVAPDRVLNIQVQGPPMESEVETTVEQYETTGTAIVLVHYCADPMPKPPREVTFSIDGNDMQVGQTWQNFYFEGTTQNNTVANCYFARLRISPIQDDDQSRQIVLKVQNQYGTRQIPVRLADLLGVSNSELSGVPTWLIVLFAVVAAGLILVVIVIICMRWQLFCFDQMKDTQAQYSSDKLKTGVHDSYIDEGSRGIFGASAGGVGGMSGGEVMRSGSATEVYMSREAVV
ncbi:ImmunoGlobulin-like Cell adhesion Molecule family [Ditylenchus destructor]|nr:ImmunoGlobulin-like Cell adhesion Molecule family [Ditylenchus destructor]